MEIKINLFPLFPQLNQGYLDLYKRSNKPPLKISGNGDRYNHREGNDDYTQAGNLFCIFDEGQKQRLYLNIAAAMQGVPQEVIDRQLVHFDKADPE